MNPWPILTPLLALAIAIPVAWRYEQRERRRWRASQQLVDLFAETRLALEFIRVIASIAAMAEAFDATVKQINDRFLEGGRR